MTDRMWTPVLVGCSLALTAVSGNQAAVAQDAAPAAPAAAPASNGPTLNITRPVAGAIVRETVPIKIDPNDVPQSGYVSVSVDGKFLTARVLPEDKNAPIFQWDSKAPYSDANDPTSKQYFTDGSHTIDVTLYGPGNKILGEGSIPVTLANKITFTNQGLMLKYKWHVDETLDYTRKTDLTVLDPGSSNLQPGTIQSSSGQFERTVEDVSDAGYLLRDKLLPTGYFAAGIQTRQIATSYRLKSKYRTFNDEGELISEMAPLGPGNHFGFPVPVLPNRRVTTGDSWQTPIPFSIDWLGQNPIDVTGEGRLDDFEWQNGYPTAKIHETYNGSLKIPLTSKSPLAGATLDQLNIDRTIYFAYNSGRVIGLTETMDITANLTAQQTAWLSSGGITTNGYGGSYPGGPGGYPGAPGGYPGAPGGYPGGGAIVASPVHLTFTLQEDLQR